MASIDFDRSGVPVQSSRVNLGPSVGWVNVLGAAISISSPGTIALPLGIGLVEVNVASGAVVIELPSAMGSAAGAMAQPASFAAGAIVITDIGGYADANPIAIIAASGETIMGETSIEIASKYGGITLNPNITTGLWTAS